MELEFEVKHKDLLGRVGVLTVAGKRVTTPAFVPVINPLNQVIPASDMKKELGCEIVITNSFIIYKRLSERAAEGVHSIIGFDGVVMTDSGGYQVLEYGEVDVSPVEIARFQELIGSDIAVPLDKPTGLVGRKQAEKTVEQTLQNVRMTMKEVGRDSRCVWVAPIQGGVYTDLIERCVDEYKEMGFSMYCLGSPTPLMTTYKYEPLVGMISAARLRISFGKPLHLFGAGHPMLFSLAVALGCDLFDSASYALFALEDRYRLSDGTVRL
ncbi:MAG: tRNA-guanine transglycosylase, partial [Candidatus Caldarchaeum sp.]